MSARLLNALLPPNWKNEYADENDSRKLPVVRAWNVLSLSGTDSVPRKSA